MFDHLLSDGDGWTTLVIKFQKSGFLGIHQIEHTLKNIGNGMKQPQLIASFDITQHMEVARAQ